jgi:multidrug resistance efflux pump
MDYLLDSDLFLGADGLVLRERKVVAAPWDARIQQLFVKPGDRVKAGEKLAVLDSASMARSMAELSIEIARMTAKIAELKARQQTVAVLLPAAQANAEKAQALSNRQTVSTAASGHFVLELNAANLAAQEHLAGILAEEKSIPQEISQNVSALTEVTTAYAKLKRMYNEGTLIAPVDGDVGTDVAAEGSVLIPGSNVLEIYSGAAYVLAYLPEGSLIGVKEGQSVQVHSGNQTAVAKVERILKITGPLPPEFQKPIKSRERGQIARIEFEQMPTFAIGQKVRISSCVTQHCDSMLKSALGFESARAKP